MKKYINVFAVIIVSFLSIFLFSSCNNENLIEDTFYMITNDVLQPNTYFKFEKINGHLVWTDESGESGVCDSYTNNSAIFVVTQEVSSGTTYKYHIKFTAKVEKSGLMTLSTHVNELDKDLDTYYCCNSKYRPESLNFYILYYDTLHEQLFAHDTGRQIRSLPEPKDEEKYFAGWYYSNLYVTEVKIGTQINDTIILYSKWVDLDESNSVTVSFETNGAESINPKIMPKGGLITVPEITKEGSIFKGWYLDKEFTQPFDGTASTDVTLYAKWKEKYRIRFLNYDGSVLSEEMVEKGYPIVYRKEKPTRDADEEAKYKFIGWDKKYEKATSDMDIIAQYERMEYGFNYELSSTNDYYIITKYVDRGNEEEIVVPEEYNGLPIRVIKSGAFSNPNLKKLIIPNVIEEIEEGALSGCSSLEYLSIPFVGDKRRQKDDIEYRTFGYIFGTTEYDNTNNVNQRCYNAENQKYFYSDYYIPKNLKYVVISDATHIPDYAFAECSILDITLVNSESIGECAFFNCQIASITLSTKLQEIGLSCFQNSSLVSISIPNNVTSLPNLLFKNCASLMSVKLTDSIEEFGTNCFEGCTKLSYIKMPNDLKVIGDWCFNGCSTLDNIDFSNEITTLGTRAFYGCASIQSIILPEKVEYIGNECFANCTRLKNIGLSKEIRSLEYGTFYNCTSLKTIVFPEKLGAIKDACFSYCQLDYLSLPASLSTLTSNAFQNCIINILDVSNVGDRIDNFLKNIPNYQCSKIIVAENVDKITTLPRGVQRLYVKNKKELSYEVYVTLGQSELNFINVYFLTENKEAEIEKGRWWYFDSDGKIVEVIIK